MRLILWDSFPQDLLSKLNHTNHKFPLPVLRVINSPGSMGEMSGHMACSLAKFDTCYHTVMFCFLSLFFPPRPLILTFAGNFYRSSMVSDFRTKMYWILTWIHYIPKYVPFSECLESGDSWCEFLSVWIVSGIRWRVRRVDSWPRITRRIRGRVGLQCLATWLVGHHGHQHGFSSYRFFQIISWM